ncbi:NADH-ubiquinone oxidoreductase-F iron-sulfur binding region domain-containing protein [Mycolicibacterium sp. 050158]|uniref:NADH-ubiquinone oxidoreductase-F iron-sulfur binding region domain-containing protein n=1 Tax=Mycolicibacterium sp. 050158 TaxID=3090602 RepID=UPI00299D296A|nr:NADH-ubiquinone oxidoreductase-F iron-sulfur binding region domain-containing protein [Mycolicibacterium sp. 050158]MDX1890743.1 NADH-ubiquinone oxidoreductase-F iron-sulfur binding region domain-containing protein [Mycolicibacterium sp. 050158]
MTSSRLLAASGPGLPDHHARFGVLPEGCAEGLIGSLDAAGLRGRGGAGFPTGRKMASITGRRAVVVGNGAEGEPLSCKDATLVTHAPHLVLDGLQLAAAAIGATEVYLYLPRRAVPAARYAIDERAGAGLDRHRVVVVEAPDTFIAGEESAAIRRIEGGRATPRDRVVPASTSGLRGRPTLVNNVETLAHVALVARYGPRWFRSVGDPDEPGTMLITSSGTSHRPTVLEVATGTALTEVLARSGAEHVGAVLVGGYHGTWIPASAIPHLRLSRAGLASSGATPGAGIVHVLAGDQCGLARTADVVAYLAEQAAQQCGPCRNGLPLLAQLFDDLAYGRVDDFVLDEIDRILGVVDGRGACRHPDGVVRFARSALRAFAGDVAAHRAGRCAAVLAAVRRTDRTPAEHSR